MQRLVAVYFAIVKPEIGLLEESHFVDRAAAWYSDPDSSDSLEPILLMVGALGSFFSLDPHPKEAELFRMTKNAMSWRKFDADPSPDTTVTWILIALYMRCTGQPHGSWLASCVAMHHAETSGLHKEVQTSDIVYPAARVVDHSLAEHPRKLFWIADALNIMFSFECGNSRVNLDESTSNKPVMDSTTHGHQFVELANLLPSDTINHERGPDPPTALVNALTCIEGMSSESSFMALMRADMAFAIYRRLWLMSLTDAKDRAKIVLDIGETALHASKKLLEDKTPWWNVLHVPFQFVNIVLALGTPSSLSHVSQTITLLQQIAVAYPTHMVLEANIQAIAMVRMYQSRTSVELEALRRSSNASSIKDPLEIGQPGGTLETQNEEWNMCTF
jgi:hypothetical protein